jgi:hypothetical protein
VTGSGFFVSWLSINAAKSLGIDWTDGKKEKKKEKKKERKKENGCQARRLLLSLPEELLLVVKTQLR